ncbi:MAG: Gldg family protein [Steroidobacteraceae bacterium]
MSQSNVSHKKSLGATALLLLAALFLGITILSTFVFRGARLDLTESKLYSLAPGTKHIIEKLDEPINLYFFFSEDASQHSPALRAYAQRVRELLEELAQRSKGKLRLTVLDPAPFSEEEDRATQFGLTPASVDAGGEPVYFGLAGTNSTDGREVIPLFQREKEEFLEYDVASLIHRLANPKRLVVGMIADLPVSSQFDPQSGRMSPGWAAIAQMQQTFELRTLAHDVKSIDQSIGTLLLIHPKNLSQDTLFAIDQFVLRGGKLLAFIDPQAEEDPAGMQMGPGAPRSSSLGPLLAAWGVDYDDKKIVGDRGLGLVVSLQQGQAPSQHIAIIGLNRDSMNAKDVVTSSLDSINLMTAGALKRRKDSKVAFEPLLTSSADAKLLPAERLAFLPDGEALLEGFKPTGEKYVIAARLHGKLATAFPHGAPALKQASQDSNVIIVADTDLLSDPLWVRAQNVFGQQVYVAWANNGDFLANALDNLGGSADLISIRGRQSFFRPFTRVDALRRQADEQLRAKAQELDRELKETEQQLSTLQSARKSNGSLVLSPEQEAELNRFQHERSRIRQELREVKRGLDVEIERLGTVLKVINIALVPALLALGALAIAILRRRRLRAGRMRSACLAR